MIRNETEYKEAVERVAQETARLKEERTKLLEMGFAKEEIKRALDPMRSFHEQLKEEVQSYERLKRGEFEELRNLEGVGRLLIALRIARGVAQRELATTAGRCGAPPQLIMGFFRTSRGNRGSRERTWTTLDSCHWPIRLHMNYNRMSEIDSLVPACEFKNRAENEHDHAIPSSGRRAGAQSRRAGRYRTQTSVKPGADGG
jgi:hypothetical protein